MGHSLRIKVHVAWLGNTLRLEARDRPATGIVAVYLANGNEAGTEPLDLSGDLEKVIREWLNGGES